MISELKPCPFCGGKADLSHTSGSYGYYAGKYCVKCPKCYIITQAFDDEIYDWNKRCHVNNHEAAKQAAIHVWNTRVGDNT